MSQLSDKLQQQWPMMIGNKSNKWRLELLELYELERDEQRVHEENLIQEYEVKVEQLESENDRLESELAKIKDQMEQQRLAHEQQFSFLHEQVSQKIALMEEQAQLYFVKNTENEAK